MWNSTSISRMSVKFSQIKPQLGASVSPPCTKNGSLFDVGWRNQGAATQGPYQLDSSQGPSLMNFTAKMISNFMTFHFWQSHLSPEGSIFPQKRKFGARKSPCANNDAYMLNMTHGWCIFYIYCAHTNWL